MARIFSVFLFMVILFPLTIKADDISNELNQLAWQFGPALGSLGEKAKINIPEGYAFLNAIDTKKFLELNHNIASDDEYLFAPRNLHWFAVFHFSSVGYVKDDETLDASKLLENVQQNTEQANEERRRRGWSTMSILGWRFQPQYDRTSNLLEWAFVAKDNNNNSEVINYNTRLLGRTGVMEVVLVANPESLSTSVDSLKSALSGFEYMPGEKYADFRQGDHVAEFGLAALIAGGAAAVATKKGLWTILAAFFAAAWKFIVAIAIGLLARFRAIFKKKR